MPISLKKPKNIGEIPLKQTKTKKEFVKSVAKHGSLTAKAEGIEITNLPQYPWDAPLVRDDVLKLFNIRLPEKDWLKLKYISECRDKSMQEFCLDFLIPAINKEIKKLMAEEHN